MMILFMSRSIKVAAFILNQSSSSRSRSLWKGSNNGMVLFSTTRKLADTLIQCVDVGTGSSNNLRLFVAVAGGGSTAISTLASTPGASKLLIEGRVLYDPSSIDAFLFKQQQHQRQLSSYCSKDAAISLAKSALYQSMILTPKPLSTRISCIGLGCTSVLVSGTPHKGQHRCHVALVSATSVSCKLYSCVLSKNPIISSASDETQRPRTRVEEEEIVSSIVLYALLKHVVSSSQQQLSNNIQLLVDEALSILHDNTILVDGEDMLIEEDTGGENNIDNNNNENASTHLTNLLHHIIANAATQENNKNYTNCVLLVPAVSAEKGAVLVPIIPTVLPTKDVIIFPGSFNPPHEGHMMLARAAVNVIRRWQKNKNNHPSVIFEMSIANADKPPMEIKEIIRRVNLFCSFQQQQQQQHQHMMPQDWSILLTTSPLFIQKVNTLNKLLVIDAMPEEEEEEETNNDNNDDGNNTKRRMTFVIGTDTFVRILNPKYYDNNITSSMLKAIRNMKRKGVHFIVGGRVEQQSSSISFVSGEEQLASMPADVQNMFTLLSEEEFRVDISSTELRKKQKETLQCEE